MKKKYKLGDYVKYYSTIVKINGRIEYANEQEGFINSIEDKLDEDGNVITRYCIGQYIGSTGYIVREQMIIYKLKAPKNKSKLEWMRMKAKCNDASIKQLNDESKSLRKEIAKLEKELLKRSMKEKENEAID